ncbi:hypothetical protein DLM75_21000 [Leptospira stimsonii]|uniref:Uncharacterized protein n=1 Tax=Leptospira stimsonii TaxID=2202203 RepID=A0A396YWB5_9LEPT|nr:hypothetical protein DLM75_21000 [Leptospira stimsonii]
MASNSFKRRDPKIEIRIRQKRKSVAIRSQKKNIQIFSKSNSFENQKPDLFCPLEGFKDNFYLR